MRDISRRDFMRRTAGALAVAAAVPAGGETAPAPLMATTVRPLGETGLACTLLGMGTGVKAGGGHSSLTRKGEQAALELLEYAYAQGLTYFDLSDSYGSHPLMKQVLQGPVDRDKVTLLTKTGSREPALVRADIERFRKEIDTDRLDIVLLHCLTTPDWPERLEGCLDVLADAKAKGVIRAHGVSCHSLDALKRAAETDWVDVILARINPFGLKMDGPPEQVAPVLQKAHATGKGVLGMKIVGEGQCKDKVAESLEYVMGLGCVDAMAIGFLAPGEVDSAIGHVRAICAA